MNNIEEYQNQVELLKQALLFYADENNYQSGMGNPSLIDLDEHGSQARFALQQLEKLDALNQKMEEDYVKNLSAQIPNETPEGILNLMKEIKKAGQDENI